MLASLFARPAFAQSWFGNPVHHAIADSIRLAYALPCVGYAVVGVDGTLNVEVIGVKKLGEDREATISDRFRIGSNTKAITAYIAALLVSEGVIQWETKFFDLFPTWKSKARKAYHDLTLQQLLSFRTPLPKWTYTNKKPKPADIQGTDAEQRMAFGRWALAQKPVPIVGNFNPSNLGYVLAGLMLEKAFGGSYEGLLGRTFYRSGKVFGFGNPSADDGYPIVGHDTELRPDSSGPNVRLNWLMAAGNLNISLLDYAKVMRRFLDLLKYGEPELSKAQAEFLFFGLPEFSLGWFWNTDPQGHRYAHNLGNPGTFLCRTRVVPDLGRAYIVFSNCMTGQGHTGTALLMDRISR
jgi:CubicO group peptidase (beta-lactamase class C family)